MLNSHTTADGSMLRVTSTGFGWVDVHVLNADGDSIATLEMHIEDLRELIDSAA